MLLIILMVEELSSPVVSCAICASDKGTCHFSGASADKTKKKEMRVFRDKIKFLVGRFYDGKDVWVKGIYCLGKCPKKNEDKQTIRLNIKGFQYTFKYNTEVECLEHIEGLLRKHFPNAYYHE